MSSSPVSTERLRKLRDTLAAELVERDLAIRMALIAAIAGEHLLLLGPPGTAKSLVSRRLHLAFAESAYFERLLTRFTVPEELFGPLSIKGLEDDRYERLTDKYLPTASIAFLDEIFKANSAILNALLTLLNEREFDNGTKRIKTPLISVIGASNELPEGEELAALSDRFLLRLYVGPVSNAAFPSLLGLRGHKSPELDGSLKLTAAELAELQGMAELVKVPEDVVAMLCALRDWCTAENIRVSDRRWRKVVKLLQVSAWTNGRDKVSVWDAWILQHCLWETPEGREKVYNWYAQRVGATATASAEHLVEIVEAHEEQLKKDKAGQAQRQDEEGNLLYRTSDGQIVTETRGKVPQLRGGKQVYMAPSNFSTRGDYYFGQGLISDRKNKGTGYTKEEVGNLYRAQHSSQFMHEAAFQTYLDDHSNWMYAESENKPEMEPTRFKDSTINAHLVGIKAIGNEITRFQSGLKTHLDSLNQEIRTHLWVSADFVEPATRRLNESKQIVESLLVRVNRLESGYDALPRELPMKPKPKAKAEANAATSADTETKPGAATLINRAANRL